MKFFAEPNLLVRVNRNVPSYRRIKHFRFNENGEFETENPKLISILKKKFKFEEIKLEDKKKEIKVPKKPPKKK